MEKNYFMFFNLFNEWPQICLTQGSFCLFPKTSTYSLNDLKYAWPKGHFVFFRKLLLIHWLTSNMLDPIVIKSFSQNFSLFIKRPQIYLTQGHFVFFWKLLLIHWMTLNMPDPRICLSFSENFSLFIEWPQICLTQGSFCFFSENFTLFIEWPQICLTQLSFCLFQKTSPCSLNDHKYDWPNSHFVFFRKLYLVHWMTSNILDPRSFCLF